MLLFQTKISGASMRRILYLYPKNADCVQFQIRKGEGRREEIRKSATSFRIVAALAVNGVDQIDFCLVNYQ